MSIKTNITRGIMLFFLSKFKIPRDISHFGFKKYANRTLLIAPGVTLAYRDLQKKAIFISWYLTKIEIKKGDFVFIMVADPVKQVELFVTAYESGITISTFSISKDTNDVVNAARLILPRLFIHDDNANSELLIQLKAEVPGIKLLSIQEVSNEYEVAKTNPIPTYKAVSITPNDIATLVFTSGTTGAPKIISFEQGIYLRSIKSIIKNIELNLKKRAPDVLLIGTPLERVGYVRLLPALLAGATIIIPEKYEAAHFFSLIQKHKVTLLHLFPSTLIDMLDVPDLSNYDIKSLTNITYGAEIMPAPKVEEAIKLFGPILQQGYASSEAFPPVSILQPNEVIENNTIISELLTSVGRVSKGVSVKIVDNKYDEVPDGTIGELLIKSNTVFKGYWKNDKLNDDIFINGYFKTGDIGYFNTNKWLFILGRKQDVITRGSAIVYPRTIEEIAHQCKYLKECVAVSVNEKLILAISLRTKFINHDPNVIKAELTTLLNSQLSPNMMPDSIEIFENIPRSDVSKILRREVRGKLTLSK